MQYVQESYLNVSIMEKLIAFLLSICFADRAATVYSPTMETSIRNETVFSPAYDPTSRPEAQTVIFISLSVLAIDELDIKNQKFTTAGWLTFEWKDSRLIWNTSVKGDIESIFVKPADIWRPEIVIDNSLSDLGVIHDKELMVRVRYDGTVDWEPLILFQTYCSVDITYYPYDKQKCTIEVVSWGYNYNEIKLEHLVSKINLQDYVENGEWHIIETSVADRNLTEHTTHGVVVYPQLDYSFYMDRRTDYYNLNVLLPIFLTSMLVCLVFLVPTRSPEKLIYVLTVQLSLAVLLTVVNDSMPSTSVTLSVLGIYLGIVLILAAIAVLMTVYIIVVHHREGDPNMASFAATVARFGSKFMCKPLGRPKEQDLGSKVIPIKVTKDGEMDEDEEEEPPVEYDVTWQDIAIAINRFCFAVFSVVTLTMNGTFFLVLGFGGKNW